MAAILLLLTFSSATSARIGETISSFKAKNKNKYKFTGIVVQDEKKSYNFNLLLDSAKLKTAPGFGAGMSVNVKKGKITGESLAISLGQNAVAGHELAVDAACDFISDTIVRPPLDPDKKQQERGLVSQAIFLAFAGKAQELKFPGSEKKIVFRRNLRGYMLIKVLDKESKK